MYGGSEPSSILITYTTLISKVNFFTSKEGVGVIESWIAVWILCSFHSAQAVGALDADGKMGRLRLPCLRGRSGRTHLLRRSGPVLHHRYHSLCAGVSSIGWGWQILRFALLLDTGRDPLGITFNTTSSAVNRLVDADILVQTSNNSRNRTFAYEAYLDILRKGTWN